MELRDHGLRVRIVLVENGIAHRVPPEPVLDDVVERNVKRAVFPGDVEQLGLRVVAVLALPVTVGPLSEHGRFPGEFAIGRDNVVEIGAVEKVIVDSVRDVGCEVERVQEAVVEKAARGVVPKNAIASSGNEERDRYVRVGLREVDGLAVIIPHAGLMLAKAVEGLGGIPEA